jgi:outer membrane protein insertion porin family
VTAVKFEGLGRVDEETARQRVKTAPGNPLDPQAITDDIRSLHGTGAFEDVVVRARPSRDGVVVVYQLKERPAIDQVLLEGNEEIDEEDLRKKITVRPGTILDLKRVERSVQSVRDHYVEQGFFLAEVDWRLDPRPDNLVNVVVVVHEHAKVKVQRVEFIGNEHVPTDELRAAMATQEGSLLGFMTGKGLFSKEIFEDDPKRVEFYYNTKGYAEAKCDPPVVMLSRDRQFIVISITVHEGEKYTVGKVEVDGDLLFPKEELEKNLKLKSGDLFNVLNVQADDTAIGTKYRDLGYAFAAVSNAHVPHRDTRIIDFTYVIQKGEIAHFGRIDIIGNDGTRDWTIRREMRVYEGDLYNETRLKESEYRIRRLGFFEKVEVRPRPGRLPDEVDVVVEIKERQTGAFTVGAGISSIENFMFQAQVSKQNFLGRGQNLSFQAILSSLRTIFMLSFEEPYFLDTNWTIGIDAYNYEMLYYDFTRLTKGLNVTFGRRITDEFGLSTTYKIEGVDVRMGGQQGVTNIPVANLFEQGLTSSLTATAYWDNRDDRMFPTKGNHSSISLEWAGKQLGSDFEYLKFMARANQYFPFVLGSVLKLSGTYGFVGSPSGAQVPLFERFYVGGIFTVRGFDRYSLGPTIPTGAARDPAAALVPFTIGGNKELIFNAEVEFPIFMPIGIRGVVFFDAGNAFDNDEQINLLALRTAAGFGIRWWSPIGPLRFEWGFPLRPRDGEPPMVFEFNIGTF